MVVFEIVEFNFITENLHSQKIKGQGQSSKRPIKNFRFGHHVSYTHNDTL